MDQGIALKRMETPTARELEETILLLEDIRSAIRAMELWLQRVADPSEENLIICPALFRDSVVQFVGCFDASAAHPLVASDIYNEQDGGLGFFNWLKDHRDAYAAHKFGAARQCAVGVFVKDGKVQQYGQLWHIYGGPVADGGRQIVDFMKLAASHAESKILSLRATLEKEANELSAEQLDLLQAAKIYGIAPEEVAGSRPEILRRRAQGVDPSSPLKKRR